MKVLHSGKREKKKILDLNYAAPKIMWYEKKSMAFCCQRQRTCTKKSKEGTRTHFLKEGSDCFSLSRRLAFSLLILVPNFKESSGEPRKGFKIPSHELECKRLLKYDGAHWIRLLLHVNQVPEICRLGGLEKRISMNKIDIMRVQLLTWRFAS